MAASTASFPVSVLHANKVSFSRSNPSVHCHQFLGRVMSGLVQFDLLFVVIFSYFALSFLQLAVGMLHKRAADVEEELEEKAADSILLKLDSVCQGTSISPSV